jgi:hypothetical protein
MVESHNYDGAVHVTPRQLSLQECTELFHATDCPTCPPVSKQDPLCAACEHLNLPHLVHCTRARWAFPEQQIHESQTVQNCALHHLISTTVLALEESGRIPKDISAILNLKPVVISQNIDQDRSIVGYFQLEFYLRELWQGNQSIPIHRTEASWGSRRNEMHLFLSGQIAWDRAISWISLCEQTHSDCTKYQHSSTALDILPSDFRLIDVQERRIVRVATAYPPYVALSYVWGMQPAISMAMSRISTIEGLEKVGGLTTALLPNAIEEAFKVCLKLKERYLWVDRFCIIQDDENDKKNQVQSMAAIFRMASFALIITCGNDMNAHLPGVATEQRVSLDYANVDGLHIRAALPDLAQNIVASVWHKRAWTYQEGILASRKLYVTSTQLVWLCSDGVVYEDISMNSSCAPDKTEHNPVHARELHLRDRESSQLSPYMTHASFYNERTLSYVSDIYHAFGGIGSALYGSWDLLKDHVCGLPAADLDATLLWYPAELTLPGARSCDQIYLPSWSWASMTGGLKFLPFFGSLVQWTCTSFGSNGHVKIVAIDASKATSFLYNYGKVQEPKMYSWHERGTLLSVQPRYYNGSPCHYVALAISQGCTESVTCKEFRDIFQHLSASQFEKEVKSRWSNYSDYYSEVLSHKVPTAPLRPKGKARSVTLHTRAEMTTVNVIPHGTHPGRLCAVNDEWWSILAPDGRRIGLMSPTPLLGESLDSNQILTLEVIAVSVGTLEWWATSCFHLDKGLGYPSSNSREDPLAVSNDYGFLELKSHGLWSDDTLFSVAPVPAINVMVIEKTGDDVWRRISVGSIFLKEWTKLNRHFEDVQIC